MFISTRAALTPALFASLLIASCTSAEPDASNESSVQGSAGCGRTHPRDETITLQAGGRQRSFLVHVPTGYDPARATPVVFGWHWYGGDPTQLDQSTGLLAKSDSAGFLWVRPIGLGTQSWNKSFNAIDCCGDAQAWNVDDLAFAAAMLDYVDQSYCADDARVFSTGISNGAFMSELLACTLAGRIAAIAPAEGQNLNFTHQRACSPSRKVPVFDLGGGADTVIPDAFTSGSMYDDAVKWAAKYSLSGPTVTADGGGRHCQVWKNAAGTADVQHCLYDGVAHTKMPAGAADAIWAWFQAHPREDATPTPPPAPAPTPSSPWHYTVGGWIGDSYAAYGGATTLGAPISTDLHPNPADGRTFYQVFQKGCIAWDWSQNNWNNNFKPLPCSAIPRYNYALQGWIGDAYARSPGGLGYPLDVEHGPSSDGRYAYQAFQNGCMAWDWSKNDWNNNFKPMPCSSVRPPP